MTTQEELKQNGFLVIRNFYSISEVEIIKKMTEEIYHAEETAGKWMKYFELSQIDGREQLCRCEYFLNYWEELNQVINGYRINNLLKEVTGQEYTLFKEKLNFKLPGGGGFSPHQDGPAFKKFSTEILITIMTPVDHSNIGNGTFEYNPDHNGSREFVPHPQNGTIDPSKAEQINWTPIELAPGDLLLFDSYLLHRSDNNLSEKSRRSLFLTYNPAAEGNMREDYFEFKRKMFPPTIERDEKSDYTQWKSNLARPLL